ncbi:MAG: hypothetical protein LBU23_06940 [Planctomycetota bacterium]|jgi:tetratricopeptide (TPR) repeat protein|nr:hypothetical protein [Planctomycetota bacterium]
MLKNHPGRVICGLFAILAWIAPARAAGEWEWTRGQGWVMGAGVSRPTPKEQLSHAYELEQRGEFMDSARQYFLLVQNFPNSPEAGVGLQRLARCLFEMENYYTSYKAIEQVIKTYPNTGRMTDLLAIELSIAKKMMVSQTPDLLARNETEDRAANIRRALEIVDSVLEHDPYGPSAAEAYLVRGEGNLFIGEINAARSAFEAVRDEFARSDFVERARLGILRCDALVGQANPAEVREQIELLRQIEADRQKEGVAAGDGSVDEFDDVDGFIRKGDEVEAAKMMEQASQYRRMGTRAAVKSSEFLYKEVARRYPGTPQAKEAMALAGDMALPPEDGLLRRNLRHLRLNPFSWNRDAEPPWIVPQINPEDMVVVDSGLGPIAGVPETGSPRQTAAAAGVRPAGLREAEADAGYSAEPAGPSRQPAPNFIDGVGRSGSDPSADGYRDVAAGAAYSPRLPANPLPTASETDLIPLDAGGAGQPLPGYAGAPVPAPIPELSPVSYPAPESQPILNSIEYNTPLSDLVGPARRPPPAPLPLDVTGGYAQTAPAANGGYYYTPAPEAYSAYPAPDYGSRGAYQGQGYEITAGAPMAAPYYNPSAASSGWTLGEDFR